MKDLNKFIALNLISAQIASDAGKSIYDLALKNKAFLENIQKLEYNTKDGFIYEAINAINHSGRNQKMYRYYITSGLDQNGHDSFIIYFDIKIDGKRYQISFHSFNKKLWKDKSGRPTRWDKNLGGSRSTAQILIDYYNL